MTSVDITRLAEWLEISCDHKCEITVDTIDNRLCIEISDKEDALLMQPELARIGEAGYVSAIVNSQVTKIRHLQRNRKDD